MNRQMNVYKSFGYVTGFREFIYDYKNVMLLLVVGMATGYGLDGPGIESRWGRDFSHLSRPALGPTQPPVQRGTGSLTG
jgi:hypothetical protein